MMMRILMGTTREGKSMILIEMVFLSEDYG